MMGGPRYEQLFRATGSMEVAGRRQDFSGSELRIRRQGVRRLEGFWGHCWQSALFGSGRAFGYIAYPPVPTVRVSVCGTPRRRSTRGTCSTATVT